MAKSVVGKEDKGTSSVQIVIGGQQSDTTVGTSPITVDQHQQQQKVNNDQEENTSTTESAKAVGMTGPEPTAAVESSTTPGASVEAPAMVVTIVELSATSDEPPATAAESIRANGSEDEDKDSETASEGGTDQEYGADFETESSEDEGDNFIGTKEPQDSSMGDGRPPSSSRTKQQIKNAAKKVKRKLRGITKKENAHRDALLEAKTFL